MRSYRESNGLNRLLSRVAIAFAIGDSVSVTRDLLSPKTLFAWRISAGHGFVQGGEHAGWHVRAFHSAGATYITGTGERRMTLRLSTALLLRPRDVQPSQCGWEVVGVLNPAVVAVGDELFMIARVAERPAERRPGWTALPRWTACGGTAVDWIRDGDLLPSDARVVTTKINGNLRLTSISHFQLLRQSVVDGDWETVGVLRPEGPWEEYGVEDPRITRIDGMYWITYVAVSRSGAATALMSSRDLVTYERHGIIFPSENKDVVLFPDRIAGEYVALHRPTPKSHFHPPQIWIARSPDLVHWGRHAPILGGWHPWEADRVGSGTPPVLIDEGYLMLYHGSAVSQIAGTVGPYAAGACLLDREDPSHVIARSREPIMLPTTDFEKSGFVPNVVFPTAQLDLGEHIGVFYGAADTCIAMTLLSKRSILDSLEQAGTQFDAVFRKGEPSGGSGI